MKFKEKHASEKGQICWIELGLKNREALISREIQRGNYGWPQKAAPTHKAFLLLFPHRDIFISTRCIIASAVQDRRPA